ncbi:MAG TPA: hypothetical protein VMT88_12470 [Actinomycetes bacterium]|nr:hypothetical protein [Actinomycetes bacterium]
MSDESPSTQVTAEAPVHVEHRAHDRWVSIVEAVLLSVVTLTVAWSGYSAAAWDGESSLGLAETQEATTEASRADLDAREEKNFDLSTFEAWFAAYVVDDQQAMALAKKRFRPAFLVAFDAWQATDPEHNPQAPRGPTYMPEYQPPELKLVAHYDALAKAEFQKAVAADANSDDYVRITVFLASVLFLVGISTHFPLRSVRYGLIGVGGLLLCISLFQLLQLPGLPG